MTRIVETRVTFAITENQRDGRARGLYLSRLHGGGADLHLTIGAGALRWRLDRDEADRLAAWLTREEDR